MNNYYIVFMFSNYLQCLGEDFIDLNTTKITPNLQFATGRTARLCMV